ncbi:MAG: hypothetical protein AB1704_20595 [Pseudomonadota bacterium]
MKKVTLLLALASVVATAMAAQLVVIKDTRSGVSVGGAPASGVLLTRLGQTCMLTEYKRSTDNANEMAVPVVDHREFRCDAQGDPV